MRTDDEFYASLQSLLKKYAKPAPKRTNKRPGRPTKARLPTSPVVLHLYRDQIAWLDEYAELLASLSPENAHLSRVEIVRGLLMALAELAYEHRLSLAPEDVIGSEHDLQSAVFRAIDKRFKRK